MRTYHNHNHICGCYYILPINSWSPPKRIYLPQVNLKAHTTILATTSRTLLTQTFVNPSKTKGIKEIRYTFPLYDGVSVVGFTCRIDDNRTIEGVVKEKEKARADFKAAVAKGQTAGLMEQLPDAADIFTTTIGNIPPGATVLVDITYLGELKHDAEVDGVRFTIPTNIAPRYGSYPGEISHAKSTPAVGKGFEVTIDALLGEGSFIQQIRSPSHPIAVSLGTLSTAPDADPVSNKASATLSLGSAELDKDFVVQVKVKDTGIPKALLETHPTIPAQRALMATLVPKFSLPPERPEIVFVCDRSGSMGGAPMDALKNALKVFLKSLPVGVKFNICSFGSNHTFLWPKSKSYSETTLQEAMTHVETFQANYGGTEMIAPIKATLKQRYTDMSLEVFLVTDGEIWDQDRLFALLNEEIGKKKAPIRVFTLGIGDSFSSSLIEGVARAGNGFSQAVGVNEKMDGKVVRMLKGALSPHITDYTLEVKYSEDDGDDFEVIEYVTDSLKVNLSISDKNAPVSEKIKKPISLFDTSANPDADISPKTDDDDGQARYSHLPVIPTPKLLQAPHNIPPLFSFSRTTVYLLMSPETTQKTPKSVILRGTSTHGPLELEIPVQVLEQPGETIHQLAAKKAIVDLEEGRGWLTDAKTEKGTSIKTKYPGRFEEMVEREAVRLGVQFQVGGKWCSFVAVESNKKKTPTKDQEGDEQMTESGNDWECLDDEMDGKTLSEEGAGQELEKPLVLKRRIASTRSSRKAKDAASPTMSSTLALGSRSGSSRDRGGAVPAPMARMASMAPSLPPAPGGHMSKSYGAAPVHSYPRMSASANSYAHPPPQVQMSYSTSSPLEADKCEDMVYFDEEDGEMNMDVSFGVFGGAPPKPSASNGGMQKMKKSAAPMRKMERSRDIDQGIMEQYQKEMESAASLPLSDEDEDEYDLGIQESSLPSDTLHALISLQTFEGSWDLNAALCKTLGLDLAKAQKAAKGVDAKVFATALAIRFFEVKLAKEEDTWELVVEKGRGWLEMQGHGEESLVWKGVNGVLA